MLFVWFPVLTLSDCATRRVGTSISSLVSHGLRLGWLSDWKARQHLFPSRGKARFEELMNDMSCAKCGKRYGKGLAAGESNDQSASS